MSEENREQVAKQCDAVAHMATALGGVHTGYAKMFRSGGATTLIEPVGKRTARLMETLGDILNGMDVCEEADGWMDPVFEEAHRLWPSTDAA